MASLVYLVDILYDASRLPRTAVMIMDEDQTVPRGLLLAADRPFTVFAASSRPLSVHQGDDQQLLDELWSDYLRDGQCGLPNRMGETPTLLGPLVSGWQRRGRIRFARDGDGDDDTPGRLSNFGQVVQRQPPATVHLPDQPPQPWFRLSLHFANFHAALFVLRRLATWYAVPPRAFDRLSCRFVPLLPPKLAEHARSLVVPALSGPAVYFYDAYLLAQLPSQPVKTWPPVLPVVPGEVQHPPARVISIGTPSVGTAFSGTARPRTLGQLEELLHKKPWQVKKPLAKAWVGKLSPDLVRTLGTIVPIGRCLH
jgi:hypothetical protein